MTLRGLDESGNKAELAGAASVGELRMWFLHQFPEIKDMSTAVNNILARVKEERAAKKEEANASLASE